VLDFGGFFVYSSLFLKYESTAKIAQITVATQDTTAITMFRITCKASLVSNFSTRLIEFGRRRLKNQAFPVIKS
jgi:hypothetical protein